MEILGFFLTRILIESFRLLPFRALYGVSDALAFILLRLVGYRRAVVWDNLRRAFPEKSEAELRAIVWSSYRNLTDVMLETMKSYTLSLTEIDRRCRVLNPDLVNRYLDRRQSIILSGAHYNNWEYSGLTMPPTFHGDTVTAYKPISNRHMDTYVNRSRARTGMIMVDMEGTFSAMRQREREGQPTVYILLADQSPSSRKSAHWVDFLGRETASVPGVDVLARKFNFPVLFYEVRRLKRGFYEVEFSEICPEPAGVEPQAITQAFARHLETILRRQPENWLWSHKRWKMQR